MADYVKGTNFAIKDGYTSGNPDKIIKGAEIDAEFTQIATKMATKANTADPTFTGTVTYQRYLSQVLRLLVLLTEEHTNGINRLYRAAHGSG